VGHTRRRPSMAHVWANTPFVEQAVLAPGTHALRLGVRYSLPEAELLTRIHGHGTVQVEFACRPGVGRLGPITYVGAVSPPPHGHVAHVHMVQLMEGEMTAEVGIEESDDLKEADRFFLRREAPGAAAEGESDADALVDAWIHATLARWKGVLTREWGEMDELPRLPGHVSYNDFMEALRRRTRQGGR